jgi:hypothetical protein
MWLRNPAWTAHARQSRHTAARSFSKLARIDPPSPDNLFTQRFELHHLGLHLTQSFGHNVNVFSHEAVIAIAPSL